MRFNSHVFLTSIPTLRRRSLTVAAVLSAAASFCVGTCTAVDAQTYTNPQRVGAADPFITYQNGTYYLMGTSLSNNIIIWSSNTLAGLGKGASTSIYDTGGFYESAEMYHFNGLWYVYYTQYPLTVKVIESDSNNPLGTYHAKATLTTNTYDASVLQMPGGGLYLLGSTFGSIVIQPMSNPYTISGGQSTIAVQDQGWENNVIEGPNPVWHNGQLDIMYSSGTYNQSNYGSSVIHFNGGDPTNKGNWNKVPGPLFTQNPNNGVWYAGVTSPFSSPDGTQSYFTYSGYNSSNNADSNRIICSQPMTFDKNNDPVMGTALPLGQPIAVPAGDPNGPASTINTGIYYRILNENSGKVAAVSGASLNLGAQLTQWDDNGTTDHNWRFVPLGDGYFHIVNQNSGLLMAVDGASTSDSANVTQWNDNGTPDHNWRLEAQGGGYYRIVNQNSQKLLAVQNGSTADGANLQQYHDNGTWDHNWILEPVGSGSPAVVAGGYYSFTNSAANLNLDDPYGTNTPGTKQQLYYANNATAQNWRFDQNPDGSFSLLNQAGGLDLDNPGGSNQQLTQIQIWNPNGATAQEWRPNLLSDGNFTFTNVAGNLVLDDPGGSNQIGTIVQLYAPNNSTAQEWHLTRH